jgi:hypothetical protein
MNYILELNEKAHDEFIDAYKWYEKKQRGLGERFMLKVDETLEYIAGQPKHYELKSGNFREAKVAVFPYLIVYEILPKENIIHVAAITMVSGIQEKNTGPGDRIL